MKLAYEPDFFLHTVRDDGRERGCVNHQAGAQGHREGCSDAVRRISRQSRIVGQFQGRGKASVVRHEFPVKSAKARASALLLLAEGLSLFLLCLLCLWK